ncbi:hypothetical protein BaRGS_00017946 [Batillaria attramentaria]|uniref:Secreted protein n=1 Tax=Batillaria attramentaria TaxID=370345 RepID=A0ABD0KUP8_9CAEN
MCLVSVALSPLSFATVSPFTSKRAVQKYSMFCRYLNKTHQKRDPWWAKCSLELNRALGICTANRGQAHPPQVKPRSHTDFHVHILRVLCSRRGLTVMRPGSNRIPRGRTGLRNVRPTIGHTRRENKQKTKSPVSDKARRLRQSSENARECITKGGELALWIFICLYLLCLFCSIIPLSSCVD